MRSRKRYIWAVQWPECETWLGPLAEVTKREYAADLHRYCDWAGMNPLELLALKEDMNSRRAEKLLDRFKATADFTDHIKARTVAAVRSFYASAYLDLARRAGRITTTKQKPYRRPTKSELREFCGGAWHLRNKALIVFTASTGIREGSLVSLTSGHVDLDEETPYIELMAKELKGRGHQGYADVEQHTFLMPEAKDLMKKYLEWRESVLGETIVDESPLFADMRKDPQTGRYGFMSTANVRKIFLQVSARTRLTFSPQDLRRYVQTQLEEAKLPPNWIRKILGKKIRGEENPYSRPKIEQLRKAYQEAIPHLAFLTPPAPSAAFAISEEDVETIKKLLEMVKQGKIRFSP